MLIVVSLVHLLLALGNVLLHLPALTLGAFWEALDPSLTPAPSRGQVACWSTFGSFAFPELFWGWLLIRQSSLSPAVARQCGGMLLALTLCQVALVPISGFWLNLLPAALILVASLPSRRLIDTGLNRRRVVG
ncbi:DUF6463 family protein [Deinococcus hopiensis]